MEYRENKAHIGFFGKCNVGKSSLINVLTGQNTAIVSQQRGTTTDIVKKTIELNDIGAVTLIDTAGLDDNTILSSQRKTKTLEAVNLVDLAVIVVSENSFDDTEQNLINTFISRNIPYIIVYNKQDIFPINETTKAEIQKYFKDLILLIYALPNTKTELTKLIGKYLKQNPYDNKDVLNGIITPKDFVVLVTPIDSAAPKGRMILPQVKMIREVLDNNCMNIVVKPEQLEYTLRTLNIKPTLVITDSQVFKMVDAIVPKDIFLTSFSILLAKEKGAFEDYLKGTPHIDYLKDGDKILLLENCSHQPTCEDIGRVKIPMMLRKYTKKNLEFKVLAGLTDMVDNVQDYALVIQCGGCMATQKQLMNRLQVFRQAKIPITNYGMAIAYANGIFKRACEVFKV